MKNQPNKLMNFRAFSIGFSAALLALACGSDSNDPAGSANGPEEVIAPSNEPDVNVDDIRETCDDNPLLAGCGDVPANVGGGDPVDPVEEPPPQQIDDPAELARAQAENVLQSNCGGCHGANVANPSAGMNYIEDIDRLVEEAKIVPLNSAASRVIVRMRDGSMPPPQSGLPQVTEADIETVAQFIDNPRFWPGEQPTGDICPDQLFTFDDLYAAVADDLRSLDDDDQLTARYISLSNRYTAGVCADASLDQDRQALFKLVNMLSTETTIEPPTPIDRDETIYRIDLDDYGWDEPVTVVNADGSTTDFVDRWEAIIANNLYAVPFVGDDADDAVADSGTTVPVMLADSLLDAASIGNLYYALIDVDVQQALDDFIINELDIDVDQNLLDEEQVRAGTTRSRISRQDRMVQRDEIEIRQGVLWQSFDFLDDQNESIFEDPFGFAEGGTEAIFTLPNGLFGFIIADDQGLIVEDSDILLDTNQNNFRAVTSISCANCHAQGLIPVVDEVRDIALRNAINIGLDADEVEQLRNVFPEAQEFARIVEQDSSRFYQSALAQANVPLQGVEPVSGVFFRFDQDVTLADAAGDLGLEPELLRENLNLLDPALSVLSRNTIDRDDYTALYANSLCILSVVNDNQPDPNFCADVEALLEQ